MKGHLATVNSDILEFEVADILKEYRRSKVMSYLELCSERLRVVRMVQQQSWKQMLET